MLLDILVDSIILEVGGWEVVNSRIGLWIYCLEMYEL